MAQESSQGSTVAEPPPHPLAEAFRQALPGIEMTVEQVPLDVVISVRREDLPRVMQAAKEDERLAFDFLRSLSGVDYLDELEVVYHLYSYGLGHSAAIKARCPPDDAHMPTVSHLWQTANWHEREAAELFGFIFDGHPDLRPLLTEEGLGYYIMRKTHPLAEIEEWQEDYLKAAEAAVAQAAAEAGVPMDERARKIEMAQKKAVVIKEARDEARAKGLSGDEEKAAVRAALTAFEEQEAAKVEAKPAEAPPKPADDRAAKIALAQKKAVVIKKARDEARAKGLSGDEEKAAVRAALTAFEEQEAAKVETKPAEAPPKPANDRAAKIALAQKKAALIKKTRDEARARGASQEEERQAVAEALKALAAEEKGGQ